MNLTERFPQEAGESNEEYQARLEEIRYSHGAAARASLKYREFDDRYWTGDPTRKDGL